MESNPNAKIYITNVDFYLVGIKKIKKLRVALLHFIQWLNNPETIFHHFKRLDGIPINFTIG